MTSNCMQRTGDLIAVYLQVQQQVLEGDIPTAEVVIGFRAEGMAPETLSLRLRPGSPHSLQLGPDAPFVLQVATALLSLRYMHAYRASQRA